MVRQLRIAPTVRVRSTAGCGALNPEIEVRILGPERFLDGALVYAATRLALNQETRGSSPLRATAGKVGRDGKAPVSKTGDGVTPAGVRVLYLPRTGRTDAA